MDTLDIAKLLPTMIMVTIEDLSDEAIIKEADERGLCLGVTHDDISDLADCVSCNDWTTAQKIIKSLVRIHQGRII